MDSFLKFLEENCPGDDAHSGAGETSKPLLERCGMCASIYEAHRNEVSLQIDALKKVALGEIQHRFAGDCPEPDEQPDARDPNCEACQAIEGKQIEKRDASGKKIVHCGSPVGECTPGVSCYCTCPSCNAIKNL